MTFSSVMPARVPVTDSTGSPHVSAFSAILKSASQRAHLSAERGFQDFLRDPSRHLASFLSAQWSAHAALLAAAPDVHPAAHGLVAGLERDCLRAGGARCDLAPDGARLHPWAADYLIFGGRKGVAVIRRLLDRDHDGEIPGHFDRDDRLDAAWRDTLDRLDRVVPNSALARTIQHDVAAGFQLFERAALACADTTAARITL